jgi:hypothetical protein
MTFPMILRSVKNEHHDNKENNVPDTNHVHQKTSVRDSHERRTVPDMMITSTDGANCSRGALCDCIVADTVVIAVHLAPEELKVKKGCMRNAHHIQKFNGFFPNVS